MDKQFIEFLTSHHWKGNIRELKNIIERAVILVNGNVIGPDLLPYEFNHAQETSSSMEMVDVERQHIMKVLSHTRGNKTETAKLLGIGLTTLYRKIEEYNITN
jgi:two-component system NtrC family response regulator